MLIVSTFVINIKNNVYSGLLVSYRENSTSPVSEHVKPVDPRAPAWPASEASFLTSAVIGMATGFLLQHESLSSK